ncbi:hypothetical protein JXJ21_19020 [candidate division KSB1 bacterium]|nr:hypothetical protein [candidate division KSB1 bacterium]
MRNASFLFSLLWIFFFIQCENKGDNLIPEFVAPPDAEKTCFQTGAQWDPGIDLQTDVAIVYFKLDSIGMQRALDSWRERGYALHVMAAVGRGAESDYVSGKWRDIDGEIDREDHSDDIQRTADGEKLRHGSASTLYYMVPTLEHTAFVQRMAMETIDFGARALHLEEPEYWANAGYSEAFKKEWRQRYQTPWQDPRTSPDAWIKAAQLKAYLYYRSVDLLFKYAKEYAREKGIENFRCYVPTHSPVNYTQWGIVSPEVQYNSLPECDGYIGQVWTGTARSPVRYNGVRRERTFENAFLEYSSLKNMVRQSGKSLWFLADPIEDNPEYDWEDYRDNYQKTLVASLMHHEISHYEVMPWPHRVFHGKYPSNSKTSQRISGKYSAELMIVSNLLGMLADTPAGSYYWNSGTRQIGIVLSEAMMYQRGSPWQSDIESFHQPAFSLIKAGMPAEVIPLERCIHPDYLSNHRILVLSYEGQKPLRSDYHECLKKWVESGGVLIFYGNQIDAFDSMTAWWNAGRQSYRSPAAHLFALLGLKETLQPGFYTCGDGALIYDAASPAELSYSSTGSLNLREHIRQAVQFIADEKYQYQCQNYILLHRGHLIAAAVMDESITDHALEIPGQFVDIFNSELPIIGKKVLRPGEQALLLDLKKISSHEPKVLLSASRIREQKVQGRNISFVSRGPIGITCHTLIKLPGMPPHIELKSKNGKRIEADIKWHIDDQILRLVYPNTAEDIFIQLFWNKSGQLS